MKNCRHYKMYIVLSLSVPQSFNREKAKRKKRIMYNLVNNSRFRLGLRERKIEILTALRVYSHARCVCRRAYALSQDQLHLSVEMTLKRVTEVK